MENDIRALVLTLLLSVAAAPRAGAQADFRLEPVMDTPTAELARKFRTPPGEAGMSCYRVVAERPHDRRGHHARSGGDEGQGVRFGVADRRRRIQPRHRQTGSRGGIPFGRVEETVPPCRPRGRPAGHHAERQCHERMESRRSIRHARARPEAADLLRDGRPGRRAGRGRTAAASHVVRLPGHLRTGRAESAGGSPDEGCGHSALVREGVLQRVGISGDFPARAAERGFRSRCGGRAAPRGGDSRHHLLFRRAETRMGRS